MLADTVIHLSYPLAFAAGVVSFLSPCVFPLAPGYLALLSGQAGRAQLGEPRPRGAGPGAMLAEGTSGAAAGPAAVPRIARVPLMLNGVAFVLGFSAVFIAFFYVLRALNVTLLLQHENLVNAVAGAIVVVLALQTLGVFHWGPLMRERRIHRLPGSGGMAAAFLLGVTFAAGWTPCIGPQLAAILSVASQGDFTGLPVMLAYCLGLAVPFLLIAALADRLQGAIRAINRHMGVVNMVAGGLLLVFGLLLLTNQFTFFNRFSPQSPFDL
ncbi:MAG TPA: cytochrome c biogenesis protein CcdA [Candidatus Dormibacteraeota bacterium]|nr:cytochrome c biogenesis protein CcdA [Candidatus Dormibacteraeota bacterium]